MPQHSDTVHSVQPRTERSCSSQNPSIPPMDDYPPFNTFTFEISPYAPTLPYQSPSPSLTSLPPSPPTWAKTGDLPTTQFYHLADGLLNSLPPFATEQPTPVTTHRRGPLPHPHHRIFPSPNHPEEAIRRCSGIHARAHTRERP